jgi:hypothetical protein
MERNMAGVENSVGQVANLPEARQIGNLPHGRRRPRRGIAAFVVLLLLSITLALSYASMRTQAVNVEIFRNSLIRPVARQNAITGLTLAMKQMTLSTWTGTETTFSGTLSPYDSFQVTYTTGDPSLTSGSSSYSDYPWRVTLLSTGYSADPINPTKTASYQVRAVVHLVPRALQTEPTNWSTMLAYTAYQTQGYGTFEVSIPSQIQGAVNIQCQTGMSREIWSNSTIRTRYYDDLNPLRNSQNLDWRPFTGNVSIANWFNVIQYSDTPTLLTALGLASTNTGMPSGNGWNPVGTTSTYRLYAGGKQYQVKSVSGSLQSVSYQPDPVANPLGIFYSSGQVSLYNNVKFTGTLVAGGNVTVCGTGTQFNPLALPSLYNTTTPIQLPVLVGAGGFYMNSSSGTAITGQMSLAGTFNIGTAPQAAISMTMIGQLIASSIYMPGRSEWINAGSTWWTNTYNAFMGQHGSSPQALYFPYYLQKTTTLNPVPQLVIKPNSTTISYHWQSLLNAQNTENPIFIPASGDGGLRWDLYQWTDSP